MAVYYKPNSSNEEQNFKPNFNTSFFKNNKISLLIVYLFFLSIFIYSSTPALNPIYKSTYFLVVINLFIFIYLLVPNKFIGTRFKKNFIGLGTFALIIYVFLIIISSPFLNSQKYHDLIGDIETVDYKKEQPTSGIDKIPIVDYSLAQKLGDKVLGTNVGLGSQYEIGEYYLISTADDIAWVAPLEPQSFLKWLQHQEGSPGYIYVSATDPNDVRLVQEIDDKPINLKYTDKSYFGKNIKRHAYFSGNATKGMTDFSFEIDDKGNPYWIISTYKPTIGFSGEDISGVITVDAQTGKSKYYDSTDPDIPSWINRIYPKSYIQEQLTSYGHYGDGWLNTITTQKNMIEPTANSSYIFKDNTPYFYTGMTSVQSDESTVGFMVTNIRTKKTTFYKLNGATETAAQKSAEGKVQQYNYSASEPILLDVFKTPSYFTTLKDADGLVKQYAFISVENYNIVGIGESVETAKTDYYNQLSNNNQLSSEDVENKSLTGSIERINFIDGKYYLKLENSDLLFTLESKVSNTLPLTQVGDNVTIEYIPGSEDYQTVITFKNTSL